MQALVCLYTASIFYAISSDPSGKGAAHCVMDERSEKLVTVPPGDISSLLASKPNYADISMLVQGNANLGYYFYCFMTFLYLL